MCPHFFLPYTDDTNIFVTGKNIENIICLLMNKELKKNVIWLNANTLLLLQKTHFIIFSFSNK